MSILQKLGAICGTLSTLDILMQGVSSEIEGHIKTLAQYVACLEGKTQSYLYMTCD